MTATGVEGALASVVLIMEGVALHHMFPHVWRSQKKNVFVR